MNNEEIYYFRIGRAGIADYAPDGFAMHRTYTPDGDVDATVTIVDEDVFVIRRGYHGPCARPARLSAVLPQRPRRPRRRALDGVLRRPQPPLGAAESGTRWPPTRGYR